MGRQAAPVRSLTEVNSGRTQSLGRRRHVARRRRRAFAEKVIFHLSFALVHNSRSRPTIVLYSRIQGSP